MDWEAASDPMMLPDLIVEQILTEMYQLVEEGRLKEMSQLVADGMTARPDVFRPVIEYLVIGPIKALGDARPRNGPRLIRSETRRLLYIRSVASKIVDQSMLC